MVYGFGDFACYSAVQEYEWLRCCSVTEGANDPAFSILVRLITATNRYRLCFRLAMCSQASGVSLLAEKHLRYCYLMIIQFLFYFVFQRDTDDNYCCTIDIRGVWLTYDGFLII